MSLPPTPPPMCYAQPRALLKSPVFLKLQVNEPDKTTADWVVRTTTRFTAWCNPRASRVEALVGSPMSGPRDLSRMAG